MSSAQLYDTIDHWQDPIWARVGRDAEQRTFRRNSLGIITLLWVIRRRTRS